MPKGKKGGPNPVWNKFIQGYRKAKNCSLCDAMKECGGENGEFAKWKAEHEMVGGGILDSINDFLWKYVAVPIGSSVGRAVRKRVLGYGEEYEEEY